MSGSCDCPEGRSKVCKGSVVGELKTGNSRMASTPLAARGLAGDPLYFDPSNPCEPLETLGVESDWGDSFLTIDLIDQMIIFMERIECKFAN